MKKKHTEIKQSISSDCLEENHKLVYEKPLFKTISLLANEVLSTCKTDGVCQDVTTLFDNTCKVS